MAERSCTCLLELQCGFGYRTAALGHFLQGRVKLIAMEESAQLLEATRDNCARNSAPVSLCKGSLHDLMCMMELGAPDALIVSSSRSSGLAESFFGFLAEANVKEVLYLSSGRSSAQQDLPKLQKSGFEVQALQVGDPMPGADHVEVRVHLMRQSRGQSACPEVLMSAMASVSWPKCDWLCKTCENLVFRRHVRQCPRCGGLRDLRAVARLQQKAELSTIIKAMQKESAVREKWLQHCKSAENCKNPMLNTHSSNHGFILKNVDALSLAPYAGILRKHGIELRSDKTVEGDELPTVHPSRSAPRQLLIVSATRSEWALQTASEAMQGVWAKRSRVGCLRGLPWIWASFDQKAQGPPQKSKADGWQWVDVKQADKMLGTECEVCVLVCIPHLQADALGALSGLLVGGGLLVLITTDGSEVGRGLRRRTPKAPKGLESSCLSRQLFWRTPFDVRFGALLEDCPHTTLDHVAGSCAHMPKDSLVWEETSKACDEYRISPQLMTSAPHEHPHPLADILELCKTVEQAKAVKAFLSQRQYGSSACELSVCTCIKAIAEATTDGSILALLAPRGRGKSSALGIAAGALLATQIRTVTDAQLAFSNQLIIIIIIIIFVSKRAIMFCAVLSDMSPMTE